MPNLQLQPAEPVNEIECPTADRDLGRTLVLLAAGAALVAKVLIAWNTIGTNDVGFFFSLGKSLTASGLKENYLSNVAFNHPPVVAYFIRAIYQWANNPLFQERGITFPLLLRLPGIIADFITVLVLLSASKRLRVPIWSLLVLALSPVSIMISGFHGNTDSIMVLFLVLAAFVTLREKPLWCGLFLALSCQIKIVPLLLFPIFFLYWLNRRATLLFTLPFAITMLLLWIEPLLKFPELFLQRVVLYGSFWGLWGITYWLRLTGIPDFQAVTYHNLNLSQQLVVTALKLLIVTAVMLIGWRRRTTDPRGLFVSLGYAWAVFFVLSPGVCAQYMVWLMPFVLVLSPILFAWLTVTSSVFLFFFYNVISGGLPWYFGLSTQRLNLFWTPWAIWPWATLIVGALLLRKHAQRQDSFNDYSLPMK